MSQFLQTLNGFGLSHGVKFRTSEMNAPEYCLPFIDLQYGRGSLVSMADLPDWFLEHGIDWKMTMWSFFSCFGLLYRISRFLKQNLTVVFWSSRKTFSYCVWFFFERHLAALVDGPVSFHGLAIAGQKELTELFFIAVMINFYIMNIFAAFSIKSNLSGGRLFQQVWARNRLFFSEIGLELHCKTANPNCLAMLFNVSFCTLP